jgi:hypothetical protein
VAERYAEARTRRISLHVWRFKEIENYLLVPEAASRIIRAGARPGVVTPTAAEIEAKIDEIVDLLRDEPVTDAITQELFIRKKGGGTAHATRRARQVVKEQWETRETRWGIAPGTRVIAALSAWPQDRFQVSFGPDQIARELSREEVHREVVAFFTAIREARSLRTPTTVWSESA